MGSDVGFLISSCQPNAGQLYKSANMFINVHNSLLQKWKIIAKKIHVDKGKKISEAIILSFNSSKTPTI